jgi:hypothetical protein
VKTYTKYEGLYKPSYDEAKDFSVECIYYDQSFGIHQCWVYMNDEQMQSISKHIPKIFQLKDIYHKYAPGDFCINIANITEVFS